MAETRISQLPFRTNKLYIVKVLLATLGLIHIGKEYKEMYSAKVISYS